MKSKLRKALYIDCVTGFNHYLNGELKKTTDEIHNYSQKFDNEDLESIRNEKYRLQAAIAQFESNNV